MEKQKIAVTGVKPTGMLHLGNYFGAVRQALEMQEEYDLRIFVANYHSMTTVHEKENLSTFTKNIVLDFLALGIDPRKCTFFLQSDVPELLELAWIFGTLPTTTVPYLERAHAYKDAEAKGESVSAGTFLYPVLMAADVLIHGADLVPVGRDQAQHLEIAREIARAFNKNYGELFKEPKGLILESVETVPGIDGQKMSKSKGNVIPLFATPDEVRSLVAKIPTDSTPVEEPKDPDTSSLFAIHKLFLSAEEEKKVRALYTEGGTGYKDLKEMLAEAIIAFTNPKREMREELAKDEKLVQDVLMMGAEKVRRTVKPKIEEVRKVVGLK